MEPATNTNAPSLTFEQRIALKKKIASQSDEEIKQALRYIIALIGVPAESIPTAESKDLMIFYIKKNWSNRDLSDIKAAFDWAVEKNPCDKKGSPLLALYGRPFSVQFIQAVVSAFIDSKAKETKPITGPNITQTAISVLSAIKEKYPETAEKLSAIGKPKVSEPAKPRERSKNEKMFDMFIAQFDAKRGDGKSARFYGIDMRIDDYLKYKTDQIARIRKYYNYGK
jgi:hypothetical protein